MLIYLDSNVFILAVLSDDKRGEKAQELIKKTILGELSAVTSSLTVDEVVWKIWKETKNRDIAIDEGLRLLQFDNLRIVGVDNNIIKHSLNFMKKYKHLKPRDAIHLSAAINAGASVIISDDADFDGVREIRRRGLG